MYTAVGWSSSSLNVCKCYGGIHKHLKAWVLGHHIHWRSREINKVMALKVLGSVRGLTLRWSNLTVCLYETTDGTNSCWITDNIFLIEVYSCIVFYIGEIKGLVILKTRQWTSLMWLRDSLSRGHFILGEKLWGSPNPGEPSHLAHMSCANSNSTDSTVGEADVYFQYIMEEL